MALHRARDRRMPARLRRQGAPDPPRLRSEEFPRGLPGLRGHHKDKVEAANLLYDYTVVVAMTCLTTGVPFAIDNPTNSYMWLLEGFKLLAEHVKVLRTDLQLCMFGSDRDKRTGLLHNLEELKELAVLCDGSHTHKPWGIEREGSGWKFATAQECE